MRKSVERRVEARLHHFRPQSKSSAGLAQSVLGPGQNTAEHERNVVVCHSTTIILQTDEQSCQTRERETRLASGRDEPSQ
jgi:hypothetical protein